MADNFSVLELKRMVAACGRGPGDLLDVLQAIQNRWNYLPEEALRHLPELGEFRPADIAGVATFYSAFRLQPAGKYFIDVCIGTACHVKGADALYAGFAEALSLAEGEDTDADRLFTLRKVACLGCCMLAPAVRIGEVIYGPLEPRQGREVLEDFLRSETGKSGRGTTEAISNPKGEVRLCLCSSCTAAGAAKVANAMRQTISAYQLPVRLREVGCTGMSHEAPLVDVVVDDVLFRYGKIVPERARELLLNHFRPKGWSKTVKGKFSALLDRLHSGSQFTPVTRHFLEERPCICADSQTTRALEAAGMTDPLDLADYRARGGFAALQSAAEMEAEGIIAKLEEHGLRGRGGGGFPTAQKWRAVQASAGDCKYVICNADEGDPGAFMDRMILESFPFRVLEGMALASKAVGAREGILYVRSEYPLAVERVRRAIEICVGEGLFAESQFRVVEGAGAFVCGEETALLASIEGRRGTPHIRPPYPSESGLWGCPTLINNVETFANVPWLLRHRVEEQQVGTKTSRGTKVFALAGKVRRGGLVEVPMGMTLHEIVEEIGGGVPDGRILKAVQVGGPSGGCIPASLCHTPVDYEALTKIGAMMGSGGLIVLDETDCMVDVARYFMSFSQLESCGKCTFCRTGTRLMLEILERLCAGEGREGDLEELEELAELTKQGSLCGLGRTAPNPVLTTLRYFRDEYEAHLAGRCPAGKCRKLVRYQITDRCIGCTRCAQRCPSGAIEMRPYEQHEIDMEKCIACDTCLHSCPVQAIIKV